MNKTKEQLETTMKMARQALACASFYGRGSVQRCIYLLEREILRLKKDEARVDWLEKTAGWSGIECFCTTSLAFNNEADVRFAFDNAMNLRKTALQELKHRKRNKHE